MNNADLLDRACKLVSEALSIPAASLGNLSRIYDFPEWDSMGQLQISISLEEKYGIEVADARTFARLTSIQAIASILCANVGQSVKIANDSSGIDIPGTFFSPGEAKSTLVLVHGICANRHEWGFYDLVALEALKHEIAVVSIDCQGHGESGVPVEDLSLQGIIAEIRSAHSWLRGQVPGAGPSMLMGNSFGGGTSLIAGCELGVDLVAMSCAVTNYEADLTRVNPSFDPSGSEPIPYSNLMLPGRLFSEMREVDAVLTEIRPQFVVPFFHGEADSDVPCKEALDFSKNISNAPFVSFPGMDHTYSAPAYEKERDATTVKYREVAANRIVEELAKHV